MSEEDTIETLKKLDEISKILQNMDNSEKKLLLDSLNKQLNIKSSRTSKKKTVSNRRKNTKNLFSDKEYEDNPEVKKATEISKKLKNNKHKVITPSRKKTKLVKVKCINCGRKYEVSETLKENFICCIK